MYDILITCAGGKFAVKHVPLNLRRILAAESAANDGLAYPFLSISIYLTVERSRRAAFEKWFLVGWLCESSLMNLLQYTLAESTGLDQVVLGTIIGALLGKQCGVSGVSDVDDDHRHRLLQGHEAVS